MIRLVLSCVCGLAFVGFGLTAFAEDAKKEEPKKAEAADQKSAGDEADQEALEKAFSERMKNTTLVGRFTVDGAPADKVAAEERYELESVVKVPDTDLWTFTARIKYGTTNVKLPVTVKMLWAGDTPMVSMTDATIPGMGTFTSRVIFHDDRYVGTWQHGKVGGHMFGRIEKMKPAEKPNGEKPEPVKPDSK